MMDRLSTKAVLIHLNVDKPDSKPVMKQFHLGGIPTVVVLDGDGKESDRIIGYDDDRSAWLKTLLGYLYGIDTIQDMESRYAATPDLMLAHDLAQKFLDRGDGAQALAWVTKARTFKPDAGTDAKLTLIEGRALLITDPPKGAQTLMAIATTPGSVQAVAAFESLSAHYKQVARNATSVEEKQKAEQARLDVFHKVVEAQPSNPDVLAEYAWFCAGKGIELDKALAAAKKAVELKPDDADYASVLAEVYFKSGDKQEALKTIDHAIQLAPGDDSLPQQKARYTQAEKAGH